MESKVSWPFFSLAVTRSYFGIPGEGSAIGIQLFRLSLTRVLAVFRTGVGRTFRCKHLTRPWPLNKHDFFRPNTFRKKSEILRYMHVEIQIELFCSIILPSFCCRGLIEELVSPEQSPHIALSRRGCIDVWVGILCCYWASKAAWHHACLDCGMVGFSSFYVVIDLSAKSPLYSICTVLAKHRNGAAKSVIISHHNIPSATTALLLPKHDRLFLGCFRWFGETISDHEPLVISKQPKSGTCSGLWIIPGSPYGIAASD